MGTIRIEISSSAKPQGFRAQDSATDLTLYTACNDERDQHRYLLADITGLAVSILLQALSAVQSCCIDEADVVALLPRFTMSKCWLLPSYTQL